jgi:hypothetical protein
MKSQQELTIILVIKKSNFQTLQESEKKPAPPIIIWVWLMNAIKQSLSTPFKKLIYLKNKIF